MLLLLTALTVMSQGPETRSPIAVVISSKRANAETHSPKIATKVLEALRKEGIGPLLDDGSANRELKQAGVDPKGCAGGQSCVAKLAVLLGPKAVVIGIDVGKISKSLAIHIDAMAADAEEPLATIDFVAAADKWSEKSTGPIAQFIAQLKDKLVIKRTTPDVPLKQQPVAGNTDSPRRPDLTPSTGADTSRPPLVTARVSKPSKTVGWVFLGSAVATAAVAGTFAGLGFADKAAFDSSRIDLGNGVYGSRLTQEQASGLASSANVKLTVALSSAIASAVLGGVSVYFFTRPAPPE